MDASQQTQTDIPSTTHIRSVYRSRKGRMLSMVLLSVLIQPMSASSLLRPSSMALLRIHVEITQDTDEPFANHCLTNNMFEQHNVTDVWSVVVFDSTSSTTSSRTGLSKQDDTTTSPFLHKTVLQLTQRTDHSPASIASDEGLFRRNAILHLPIPRPSCILSQEQNSVLQQNIPTHPIKCEQFIVVALYKSIPISDARNITKAVKRIVHTISHDPISSVSSERQLEPIRIDLRHYENTSHLEHNERYFSCNNKQRTRSEGTDDEVYSWHGFIPISLPLGCFFILYKYFWNQSHLDWIDIKSHWMTIMEYVHESLIQIKQSVANDDSSGEHEEFSVTSRTSINQPVIHSRSCRSCHESRAESWMEKSDWKRSIEQEDDSDEEEITVGNIILRVPTTIRKYWRRTIDNDFEDEDCNTWNTSFDRKKSHRSCELLFERGSMMNYRELQWSKTVEKSKSLTPGNRSSLPMADSLYPFTANKKGNAKVPAEYDTYTGNPNTFIATIQYDVEKQLKNDVSQKDNLPANSVNPSDSKRKYDDSVLTKNIDEREYDHVEKPSTKSFPKVAPSRKVQWSDEMSYSGEHDSTEVQSTTSDSGEPQMTDQNVITTESRYDHTNQVKEKPSFYEGKPSSVVFDVMIVDSTSDDGRSVSSYCKSLQSASESLEEDTQNRMPYVARVMNSNDIFDRKHDDELQASIEKDHDDQIRDCQAPQFSTTEKEEDLFEFENDSNDSVISQNGTIKISPMKEKKVFKPPSLRVHKPSVGLLHATQKFSAPVWEHSLTASHDGTNNEARDIIEKKKHLHRHKIQYQRQQKHKNISKSSNKTTSTVSETKTKSLNRKGNPRSRRNGSISCDNIPTCIEIKVSNEKETSWTETISTSFKRKRGKEDTTSIDSETSSKRSRAY
jgi:hypothetical protein